MSEQPTPAVKDSLTPQKPRCPWPVHLWPPGAIACEVGKIMMHITFADTSRLCSVPFANEGNIPLDTTWTRAEALASQMLPAPDREGVWAVYFEGAFYEIDYFNDFEEHSRPDFPNQKYIMGKSDWDINSVFKFYYMGPLPEGEVQP